MQALLDGDIFLYEIGFGSQESIFNPVTNENEILPRPWAFAQNILENKLEVIQDEVRATEPPLFFFSSSPYIIALLNKQLVREGEKELEHAVNFRMGVAKTRVYKGTRKADKPYHFYNLISHIMASYQFRVSDNGLEADDALAIEQCSRSNTIIVSRDKDLKTVPGFHYSWEVNNGPSWGPIETVEPGFLEKKFRKVKHKKTNEDIQQFAGIRGTGSKFFYAQMIMGDQSDNVPGLPGKGPAAAYNLLHDVTTVRECYERTRDEYIKIYGEDWKTVFTEMANLLWIIRELKPDGSPIMWTPPKKE